jgi:flavin-binding protein dodecin
VLLRARTAAWRHREVFEGRGSGKSVERRIRPLRNDVRSGPYVRTAVPGSAGNAAPEAAAGTSGRDVVSDHVYGLTEVVGSSTTSVDDAVRTAIRKAARTVRNIEWFEAKEIRGQVVDGDVGYFQVTVRFGFRIE